MGKRQKQRINTFLRYLLLIGLGIIMIYPLCWMVGASFKTNAELFSSASIFPLEPTLDGYRNGYKGYEGMTLLHCRAAVHLVSSSGGVKRASVHFI